MHIYIELSGGQLMLNFFSETHWKMRQSGQTAKNRASVKHTSMMPGLYIYIFIIIHTYSDDVHKCSRLSPLVASYRWHPESPGAHRQFAANSPAFTSFECRKMVGKNVVKIR
jgi:hypothetical protein